MRKLAAAPLFAGVLLLAGCGTSNQSAESAGGSSSSAAGSSALAAPAATAVTGTITLASDSPEVAPGAKLELSLVDVTQQPAATINKQVFDPPQFPQAFHIPFSATAINPTHLYVMQATMEAGGRGWSTTLQQPVLTRGQPANVELTLAAEPTPAEKMLSDFQQAKRQIGGMQVKSGTSSKIGESRSWQVFNDVHGIEFIILQVNHGDKGAFTKTQYAYHAGKPWIVVEETMPNPTAEPTSVQRAGWDDQGVLVLNQDVKGDKTTELSESDAKDLHQDAEAALKLKTK